MHSEGFVQANGSDIKMTVYSLPEAMDWNEDGLIDLIHCGKNGGYSDPNILLYINEGTKTNYKFGTPVNIMSNGSPMYHISPPTPHVIDYNRDGKKDLMIGTFSGKIAYYENEGANNSPVFGNPIYLQHGPMDDDEIFVAKTWEGTSTPEIKAHFCDWNKDGYWDIIMGGGKTVQDLFISYGKSSTPIISKTKASNNFISISNRYGTLSIVNNHKTKIDIEIYNAKGTIVRSKQILNTRESTVIKEQFSKGVYFLKSNIKGTIKTLKFIIK